jgi:hypothetical protein
MLSRRSFLAYQSRLVGYLSFVFDLSFTIHVFTHFAPFGVRQISSRFLPFFCLFRPGAKRGNNRYLVESGYFTAC